MKRLFTESAKNHPYMFGVVMTVAMLVAKIPFTPLILKLGGSGTTESVISYGAGLFALSFLFLPFETFLGQAFPIWVLTRLRVRRWRWLIFGSSLFFGSLHLGVDAGSFFIGFAGGLALSVCWLAWREESLKRAFWGTTGVHIAHNAVAFMIFMLFLA